MNEKPETLSHYTSIPALLYILSKGKIVFGDPDKWEDRTDVKALEYVLKHITSKSKDKNINIRALCLTNFPEDMYDNILHWKIYTPEKAGCRIDFDMKLLEEAVNKSKAKMKEVEYLSSKAIKEKLKGKSEYSPIDTSFIKHKSYSFENEWRIIWFGKAKIFRLNISKFLKKGIIKKVKFSSDLPEAVAKNLRSILKKENGKIKFEHSQISSNPSWLQIVKKIIDKSVCNTSLSHSENPKNSG